MVEHGFWYRFFEWAAIVVALVVSALGVVAAVFAVWAAAYLT